MSVTKRFERFLSNITLSSTQIQDGEAMRRNVVGVLNKAYWSISSETSNSLFVGSWGKQTRMRPPRDVDVLFEMPWHVYHRFDKHSGNKQSQLLQEVRGHLLAAFPNTKIKGDGPVVIAPFSAYAVELIPAFPYSDGKYCICMTDNGGRYKTADYKAEIAHIASWDAHSNGNLRDLVRMMKCWQWYCSVPLKSFHLELVAVDFMSQWRHRGQSKLYYDLMVRDFLAYLVGRANTYVYAPGTGEQMFLWNNWKSKAESASARAVNACAYEAINKPDEAGDEWQKIFGTDIPKYP